MWCRKLRIMLFTAVKYITVSCRWGAGCVLAKYVNQRWASFCKCKSQNTVSFGHMGSITERDEYNVPHKRENRAASDHWYYLTESYYSKGSCERPEMPSWNTHWPEGNPNIFHFYSDSLSTNLYPQNFSTAIYSVLFRVSEDMLYKLLL